MLEGRLAVLWSFPAGCESPGCNRVGGPDDAMESAKNG